MPTARFSGAAKIVASVKCSPKRDGSYRLKLWKAGENKIVKQWEGNFINEDDDEFALPTPNSAHNGRILECLLVVAIPAGVGPSTVSLTVSQKGVVIGEDTKDIAPGTAAGLADLFIQLEKA